MTQLDSQTRSLLRENTEARRGWVIYQLTIRGRTLADIAREAGVKRQTLYMVWSRPYPRMEHLIAQELGIHPAEIWPDRYDENGLPIGRRGRPRKDAARRDDATKVAEHGRAKVGNGRSRRVA